VAARSAETAMRLGRISMIDKGVSGKDQVPVFEMAIPFHRNGGGTRPFWRCGGEAI